MYGRPESGHPCLKGALLRSSRGCVWRTEGQSGIAGHPCLCRTYGVSCCHVILVTRYTCNNHGTVAPYEQDTYSSRAISHSSSVCGAVSCICKRSGTKCILLVDPSIALPPTPPTLLSDAMFEHIGCPFMSAAPKWVSPSARLFRMSDILDLLGGVLYFSAAADGFSCKLQRGRVATALVRVSIALRRMMYREKRLRQEGAQILTGRDPCPGIPGTTSCRGAASVEKISDLARFFSK